MTATSRSARSVGDRRSLPLLRALRPKQWTKNLLVVAAPVAGGVILERDVIVSTAIAFVVFCLAASGIYLVNDVRDVEEDRAHPHKRYRPIAAGELAPPAAIAMAAALIVAAGVIASVSGLPLVLLVGVYATASLAYSFGLRDQPVLDIAIVTSGFVLRAAAGGVAAGLQLSQWFLLAAAFGSLFVVAGKRYSEILLVGEGHGASRRSLATYSVSYLRFVWTMAATITVATYALWAFEVQTSFVRPVLAQASIAPFVLALLRYAVDVDQGGAGDPEDIILGDRVLQLLGLGWLLLFVSGVWGA